MFLVGSLELELVVNHLLILPAYYIYSMETQKQEVADSHSNSAVPDTRQDLLTGPKGRAPGLFA